MLIHFIEWYYVFVFYPSNVRSNPKFWDKVQGKVHAQAVPQGGNNPAKHGMAPPLVGLELGLGLG